MRVPAQIPRLGRRSEDSASGQVRVFAVLVAAVVVLFAGLALDGGLALAAKVRAIGQAQEAARAGAQGLDLDAYRRDGTLRLVPDRARRLARGYLRQAGVDGVTTASATTVTVEVTIRHDARLLGAAGLDVLTVTATGSAHPRRGIATPE